MAFDGITVAALVQELKHTLTDGRINKIAQPETDELLLTIKTADGMKRLSISASASLPLIYLTEENKPSPMTAPGFCFSENILTTGGSSGFPSQSWNELSISTLSIWMKWAIYAARH